MTLEQSTQIRSKGKRSRSWLALILFAGIQNAFQKFISRLRKKNVKGEETELHSTENCTNQNNLDETLPIETRNIEYNESMSQRRPWNPFCPSNSEDECDGRKTPECCQSGTYFYPFGRDSDSPLVSKGFIPD